MKLRTILAQEGIEKRAAMAEGEFWKLVDSIGWGRKTTNSKAIQKALLRDMTLKEAEGLSETFYKLQGKLQSRITKWEQAEDMELAVGDDGFGDITAHIIGLGKREYDAVMKDPKKAYDRAQKYDYVESFSYALPSKYDFQEKAKGLSKYTDWAHKVIDEYRHTAKHPAFAPVKADINALIAGLEVLAEGNPKEFLALTADLKAKAELIENYWEEVQKAASPEGYSSATTNKWSVWNLLSDLADGLD